MFRYEKLFILLHALPSALVFVHTYFTGKKNFRDPIMDKPGEIFWFLQLEFSCIKNVPLNYLAWKNTQNTGIINVTTR